MNESDINTTADQPDESYLKDSSNSASSDPTLNESDFDTSAPPPDESYLGASSGSNDPTVAESDFDTSVPPADESYLSGEGAGAGDGGDARGTPGPALVALLSALGLVAIGLRRR